MPLNLFFWNIFWKCLAISIFWYRNLRWSRFVKKYWHFFRICDNPWQICVFQIFLKWLTQKCQINFRSKCWVISLVKHCLSSYTNCIFCAPLSFLLYHTHTIRNPFSEKAYQFCFSFGTYQIRSQNVGV